MSNPAFEENLFHDALARSASGRDAFLRQACAGDAALRARIDTLLAAYDRAPTYLDQAPVIRPASPIEEKPGQMIGRYKILQKIGEGGCGVVYMAEQEQPVRRRVALKVIKLGMDTKEVIARFEAERQAVAMMDHPHIAKVFDAGATDTGRPYFVMELVRGLPITKYCDEAKLSARARLELFIPVCNAIQHAHQKGVIHRDIKPSNVLVTVNDGVAVPKVIDFGIAKATHGRLTDATLFTAFEQFIGTPTYMSPEQAAMTSLDIDTRSDIYSLGVLLYELLTGRPPFDARELAKAGLEEIRRQIREVEPARPSTCVSTQSGADQTTTARLRQVEAPRLVNLLRGDLDWIVMRCLEKDRSRRYETATGLALDLQNHLRDEPVTACPPSAVYRLSKAIRRNKVAFGAGAAIAGSLAIGIFVSVMAYFREKAAHEFAVQAAQSEREAIRAASTQNSRIETADRKVRDSEKKATIEAARNAYTLPLLKETLKGLASGSIPAIDRARLRQTLDQSADRLGQDTAIPPDAQRVLYEILGDAYLELGENARAEQMYRELLALRRKWSGGYQDTDAALEKLIEALKRQGKSAEAEAEKNGAKVLRMEYLKGGLGYHMFFARELLQRGKYAEGEAYLWEAIANFNNRKRYPDGFAKMFLLGDIALARFQGGDFAAAREVANDWLSAEYEFRSWIFRVGAERDGLFGGGRYANKNVIFGANCLFGRMALREGDLPAAKNYLLKAVPPRRATLVYKAQLNYALAAELLAAGERDTVIQFLNRVEKYLVSYRWRSPEGDEVYIWEASEREDAAHFNQWRKEVLAGMVPDDWKSWLRPPLPATSSALPPSLPPRQVKSPLLREMRSMLTQLEFPFGFQMLGWVLAAPILRRRSTSFADGSRRTVFWFCMFGAVCVVECALWWASFSGNKSQLEAAFLEVALVISSLAGGIVLWEIRRALRGETTVGRTTLLLRLSIAFLAVFLLVVVTERSRAGLSGAEAHFVTAFEMIPLLWVIPISITLTVVWELLKWTHRHASLPSRTTFCLYLAAPILGAQVVTSNWAVLEIIYDYSPSFSILVLWLSVLLPWLLVCGFAVARTPAVYAITPPLAATQ